MTRAPSSISVFLLVMVVFISGCAAERKLDGAIKQSKSVGEEFVAQEHAFELYPARCIDESTSDCSAYVVYGALHGNKSLLITANPQVITEDQNGKKEGPYNLRSQDLDADSADRLKDSLGRRIQMTGGFVAHRFPKIDLKDKEAIVVVLKGYVDGDVLVEISRKEELKGRTIFILTLNKYHTVYSYIIGGANYQKNKYGIFYVDRYPFGGDFAMEARSEARSALMGVGYIFTFLFDIITAPIQLMNVCITCR